MNNDEPNSAANANSDGYYYAQGKKHPLVKLPNLLALKFGTAKIPLSEEAQALLRSRAEPVTFLAQYGIKVYRSDIRDHMISVLDREQAVEFATPVYRQSPSNEQAMYVTRRFLVQFKPDVSQDRIAAINTKYNVQIVDKLDYVENGYVLLAPEGSGVGGAVELANKYYETGLVIFSHPDLIKSRSIRSAMRSAMEVEVTPKDTTGIYLSKQWHLVTSKVKDAWGITMGSSGITVAILDDGCDTQHPEFASKITRQFDFGRQVADVTPQTSEDNHGTACAGVATARGAKAYGSAPACSLMVARTPQYLGSADEATMFTWAADNGADIISCSWGPADGTGSADPLPDNVGAAIHEVVKSGGRGRGGKGIPIVWAAGNGNESVSLDGYASNPDVMAIAASTSKETKAWYSDFGKEIWICAPSSGNSSMGEQGIFTVDRKGSDGYNAGSADEGDAAGDYTNSFGGTSSATPLVAGTIGLMLSINSNLTAQQVKEILKQTADKIGSGYDSNGHSNEFGYGRLNALKAVEMAKNPPQVNDGGIGSNDTSTEGASIKGPDSMSRDADPPTFNVIVPQGRFYAVEVATDTSLLTAEQSNEGFFATWQKGDFLSGPTYTLDSDAWDRLKKGDRLFYRIWTNAIQEDWQDPMMAHPPDEQIENAPWMEITGEASSNDGGSGSNDTSTEDASIEGPDSISRDGDPPTFNVIVPQGRFYAVEVATDTSLLTAEQSNEGFFATWQKGDFLSGPTYTLDSDAWDRLKKGDRLFYRIWTNAIQEDWQDPMMAHPPDEQIENAPWMEITGEASSNDGRSEDRTARRSPKSLRPPFIEGPDVAEPGGAPPTFRIIPDSPCYYAVELAVDPHLFAANNKPGLSIQRFYGSWTQGLELMKANGPTTYTVPASVWRAMKGARRLYYRVVTSSKEYWTDVSSSTSVLDPRDIPFIDLTHPLIVAHSVDSDSFHSNIWRRGWKGTGLESSDARVQLAASPRSEDQGVFDDADKLGIFIYDSKAFDKLRRSTIAGARAIVESFRVRGDAGAWPSLDRSQVADRLLALLGSASGDEADTPDEAGRAIQQGSMNLCGPAAFFQFVIKRDPVMFATYATDLFDIGQGSLGSLAIVPSDDLRLADYASLLPNMTSGVCPQADWMVLGALRNSTGVFWTGSFHGDPEQELAAATRPEELADWLTQTGLYSDVTNEANWMQSAGYPHAADLPLGEGADVAALINADLIRAARNLPPSSSWPMTEFPNHWVVVLGETVKYVTKDAISFNIWSWGESHILAVPIDAFIQNYYGAVKAIFAP